MCFKAAPPPRSAFVQNSLYLSKVLRRTPKRYVMVNPFKKLLPQRRSITILGIIVLILGSAFSVYYFYYIPNNREQLHAYSFAILQRVATNVNSRNDDLNKLYLNITGNYRNDSLAAWQKREIPGGARPVTMPQHAAGEVSPVISGKDFYYASRTDSGAYALRLPAYDLMAPVTVYRHELFSHFLLLHASPAGASILYADKGLGVNEGMLGDSLFAFNNGTPFSNIVELNVQGLRYKMFTFPFSMNGQRLMLCGLISNGAYARHLNNIPVSFVYPLIIILLFVIIFLPFVKIYLMGRFEKISFFDLVMLCASVFFGMTILAVIVIQVLLLSGGYIRVRQNLDTISEKVENSLRDEIKELQAKLVVIDSEFYAAKARQADTLASLARQAQQSVPLSRVFKKIGLDSVISAKMAYRTTKFNIQSQAAAKEVDIPYDNSYPYFNYDRVVWVGGNGTQLYKVQLNPGHDLQGYIDVSGRNYFQYFRKREAAGIGGDSTYYLEPLRSWSSGDFRVNFVMRSRLKNEALLVMLSTKMYSLIHTILPPGYGFCLIDREGNVQVHSEEGRSLRENFLEEVGDSRELQEALVSRQDKTIGSISCYGKQHTMKIHPLAGSDFYIVTFHDNNYIVPINLRILLFALFFSSILCCMVLLLLFMIRIRNLKISEMFPIIEYFHWAIPKKSLHFVYVHGSFAILTYLFVFILLSLVQFNGRALLSDYTTFMITLLSPLNMLLLLHTYRVGCCRARTGSRGEERLFTHRWYFLYPAAILIGYTCLLAWVMDFLKYRYQLPYWIFQFGVLLVLIGCWYLWSFRSRERRFFRRAARQGRWKRLRRLGDQLKSRGWFRLNWDHYCMSYSYFVLLLALFFSALPVSIFTWYAHNHEIIQSVKKQQLHLARQLDGRRPLIAEIIGNHQLENPVLLPREYTRLQYTKGIYSVYEDTVVRRSTAATQTECPKDWTDHDLSEYFYFKLADAVCNKYYDPLSYPALEHNASDNSWYWNQVNDTTKLVYNLPYDPTLDKGQESMQLTVMSKNPQRFLFLGWNMNTFLMACVVGTLLWWMWLLIKNTASRLFLLRFIRIYAPVAAHVPSEKDIYKLENEMTGAFMNTSALSEMEAEWDNCSENERLVLFDIAKDGLLNFRNTREIRSLMARGIIIYNLEQLQLSGYAFRRFILDKRSAGEEFKLLKDNKQAVSVWEAFRTPVLVIVMAVAAFIFLTQEEVSRKIGALITTAGTALPLLANLLWSKGGGGEKKE